MGNIRREGQCEGEEPPSADLSGHDQQMGGQGEGDSWRDGGDKAEIEERGEEMQNRSVETGQHVKKKIKDENGKNRDVEKQRE